MSPALANSLRFSAVVNRLAVNLQNAVDLPERASLCLSLARGIDFALANNEVPASMQGYQDLPRLLKQLCEFRNDIYVQAEIMVLMISVKNACAIGWFPEDSEALLNLASEGFQPLMKMGKILSSLEIKYLFVVQTDNIETSACLISPQKNELPFKWKGSGEKNQFSMEPGPQVPTNMTGMLKYGTNIVQAVGQFDERRHYLRLPCQRIMSSLVLPLWIQILRSLRAHHAYRSIAT